MLPESTETTNTPTKRFLENLEKLGHLKSSVLRSLIAKTTEDAPISIEEAFKIICNEMFQGIVSINKLACYQAAIGVLDSFIIMHSDRLSNPQDDQLGLAAIFSAEVDAIQKPDVDRRAQLRQELQAIERELTAAAEPSPLGLNDKQEVILTATGEVVEITDDIHVKVMLATINNVVITTELLRKAGYDDTRLVRAYGANKIPDTTIVGHALDDTNSADAIRTLRECDWTDQRIIATINKLYTHNSEAVHYLFTGFIENGMKADECAKLLYDYGNDVDAILNEFVQHFWWDNDNPDHAAGIKFLHTELGINPGRIKSTIPKRYSGEVFSALVDQTCNVKLE